MDNIQNAPSDDDLPPSEWHKMHKPNNMPPGHLKLEKHKSNPFNLNQNSVFNEDFKYPYEKYSRAANWRNENAPSAAAYTRNSDYNGGSSNSSSYNNNKKQKRQTDDEWHAESHERVRRAPRSKEENKSTCSLYIQTDPLIWRHIREGIADVSIIITH